MILTGGSCLVAYIRLTFGNTGMWPNLTVSFERKAVASK
jgi:hypothetical protein